MKFANRGQRGLSEGNLWCPIQSVADYLKGRLSEGNLWCPIQSVADYLKGRLSEGNLWCPRIERRFL